VADLIQGNSEMPKALALFPSEGKKTNEETYLNENVLGHTFLNKAFRANYTSGNDEFSIFIVENSTPEETRFIVNAYLKSGGIDEEDSEAGRYMMKDGNNGTIFLAWKDSRIVIISGLSKDQSDIADKYTSEILK
jgi:hypothetical protein